MPKEWNYIIRLHSSIWRTVILLESLAESMKQTVQSMDYEFPLPRYMTQQLLLLMHVILKLLLFYKSIETFIELVKYVLYNGMCSVLNGIS